jgi:hypothetical protein
MALADSGAALFAGSLDEFTTLAPASQLTAHLTREFNRRWGTATESEILSWRNSLTALSEVLEESELDRLGVGVELKLPLTDRRVDVSFVARDSNGDPTAILVELKQWSDVAPSLFPDNVVVFGHETLNPAIQVSAYAQYLRDSHSAFSRDGFRLSACAYLHNMPRTVVDSINSVDFGSLEPAPLFSRDDRLELNAFLSRSLSGGGGMELLPNVVSGSYRPSATLLAGIALALEDSSSWTLLDEQRVTYNVVRGQVEAATNAGGKATVIVTGGPGTGKSVIAAHLVVNIGREGRAVVHATGSKAFTTNLRALGPNPRSSGALFRYFNNFREHQTQPNAVDVLVADEAHRIRESSNDRFTKSAVQSGISQARELVRAAKVSVFFIDERQNVRPGEIGTVEAIHDAAAAEGSTVTTLSLTAQFRCSGCGGYLEWVDELTSSSPAAVGPWHQAGEYDLRVFETPAQMEKTLIQLARDGASARLVAGFCWPWSDPRPDGSLLPDVEIGAWRRPWNEKPPEQRKPVRPPPRADRHPYTLWATDPARIREIGCIYSAQGFEFDYCGVILGNDLVWRGEHAWLADKTMSSDPALLRRRLSEDAVRALLSHTYRVLLTRGIKGTFVYSTDAETRALFRQLLRELPK